MQLDYTVVTKKPYEEAVQAVQDAATAHGFRVQFVHDVAETLAEKGFDRDPVTIIEMCNAKQASQVLARDIKLGLMLPCPVMVYVEDDEVYVSTMRPTLIGAFFPEADIDAVAQAVETEMFALVDEAAA